MLYRFVPAGVGGAMYELANHTNKVPRCLLARTNLFWAMRLKTCAALTRDEGEFLSPPRTLVGYKRRFCAGGALPCRKVTVRWMSLTRLIDSCQSRDESGYRRTGTWQITAVLQHGVKYRYAGCQLRLNLWPVLCAVW